MSNSNVDIDSIPGGGDSSPLPPSVIRGLGDRSYDKRKAAALDVTAVVRVLQETGEKDKITTVIFLLSNVRRNK